MKKNLFYNIIQEWNGLSLKEKLANLQKFEELNADFEGRKAREIVLKQIQRLDADAEYRFNEPNLIIINNNRINNKNPFKMLENVFHEGFHALCDDYFNNKTDLKAFSQVDKERLIDERRKVDLIYNRAYHERALTLFSLAYYEEKLVRKETCLYFIYNLLQCYENMADCQKLIEIYHENIGSYYSYETFKNHIDMQYETHSYEEIRRLVDVMDIKIYSDRLREVNTDKNVVQYPQSSTVLRNFERGLEELSKFQNNIIGNQEYVSRQCQNLDESKLLLR